MLTENDALTKILSGTHPLPPRPASLGEAVGRFSAQDIFARYALPVFDNSAMDGYAVVAGSCLKSVKQRVVGEQPAGLNRNLQIKPGEAVRIFTGAPVPAGADAIVMQEDVRREGSEIAIGTTVEPGQYVRRRGLDLSEGQKILGVGERIRPQTLGLLAAQGFAELNIGGDLRVAIVTTGDELVAPGQPIAAGQIYESNAIVLDALFRKSGVSIVTREQCPDEPAFLEAALRKGLEHDVLVVVGGVSVGERDLVKPALRAIGAEIDLWRVAVKPGKPFLFGRAAGCAIFGLPGNPVSAFITFLLFVRPAILKLMGAAEGELFLPRCRAELAESVTNADARPHYVRGRLEDGRFLQVGRQESHAVFGLSRANALLRVLPGQNLTAGAPVMVLALD
jgi:molybdopterin molybdotransferase